MKQHSLKEQIVTRGGKLLAAFLFSLYALVSVGQNCTDARDCQQRSQQLRRQAQDLKQQRLAKEQQYRQRTHELQHPPPREVCQQTPQGQVCRKTSPMVVDDRKQLQDEIDKLGQREQDAERQAAQLEQVGGRRPDGPGCTSSSRRQHLGA